MAATSNNILSINTATTNIPATGSPVQLTASGGTPIPTSKILVTNETASTIVLYIGAAGSEIAYAAFAPATQQVLDLSLNVIPMGARLSLLALDTAASSKYFSVSVLP